MLKLYKEINGVLHYWETWDEDDKTGLVHWGTVGENGEQKKVKSTLLKNFHKIIQQEINEKINEGYEQIDEDDLKFLIIEYKLNSDFGNEEDLEKRHRLEAKMNEDLGWNLSLGNWLFSHGRRGQGNTGSRCSNSKSPHGVHFTYNLQRTSMKVALIVAVDQQFGIGKNNDLMWHLPADMKFFKETTTGHIVVTGRKNYDSIPERFRPLPNRENAVLTRNTEYHAPGAVVFSSLESCLDHYKNEVERTVFIIGGGQIYREALALDCVQEMFITHVQGEFGADTFFPKFEAVAWNVETVATQVVDEKNAYAFEVKRYWR